MSARPAEPPHVFTLTGNLLAERTLDFAAWTPGRTQRAAAESFQVGGKGINVAKMLQRLGCATTALYFRGGAPGSECEAWLAQQPFPSRGFHTTRPTRVGTVVRDRSGAQRETTFLGPDVPPDAAAVRACAEFLEAQPAGQVLALCGSLPGWAEPETQPLRAALEHWTQRGHLVVDTYGPPLAWAVTRPLALIKINADEVRSLPGGVLPPTVRRWIVTDGPGAVRVQDETGALETLTPPAVREISPTGSGDVLLAGVLEGHYARGLRLVEAVRRALPLASANAAHPGIAEFALPPGFGAA